MGTIRLEPDITPIRSATGRPQSWWSRLTGGPNRPLAVASGLAAVLALLFVLLPYTGQDLAAQIARADFARVNPLAPVDFRWFGGTLPFGYSLWVPWVASWAGVRVLGAIGVVLGTALTMVLLRRARPVHPVAAGIVVAVCQTADMAVGRLTYHCGLVCALGALCCVLVDSPGRRRRGAAAGLAALAGGASPVVTLELWTVAAALFLRGRRRDAVLLAVASAVPTAITSVVFADGAFMSFASSTAVRAVLSAVLVIAFVPRVHRGIRLGAVFGLLVVLAAWIVPSQVGSNADRLGLLFALPVIVAFVPWKRWVAIAAVLVAFVAQPPTSQEVFTLAGTPETDVSYYEPVITAVLAQGPLTGRIESPEFNGHWDSAYLARNLPLARGWLRQVDTELNDDVFFRAPPNAADYRDWLARNAVQWVAVPDAHLTPDGNRERALIQSGLPYLTSVWHDAHWTLYSVRGAQQIIAAPAHVVMQTPARITVSVPRAGTDALHLRWFRWLSVDGPDGACVAPGPDGVALTVAHPGTYVITSRLPDGGRHCA